MIAPSQTAFSLLFLYLLCRHGEFCCFCDLDLNDTFSKTQTGTKKAKNENFFNLLLEKADRHQMKPRVGKHRQVPKIPKKKSLKKWVIVKLQLE